MRTKNIIYGLFWLVILVALCLSTCFAQCPPEGAGKNAKEKAANVLKNREIVEQAYLPEVTLSAILSPGNDENRFTNDMYVKITGYLVDIEKGKAESCNCGTITDSLTDIHLYIGLNPNAEKKDCCIVEITAKYKKLHKDFNPWLMKGHLVNISGFTLWDYEHAGSARNTCTHCDHIWRATAWEPCHPVCKIELAPEE
jgi:hypothetical protein